MPTDLIPPLSEGIVIKPSLTKAVGLMFLGVLMAIIGGLKTYEHYFNADAVRLDPCSGFVLSIGIALTFYALRPIKNDTRFIVGNDRVQRLIDIAGESKVSFDIPFTNIQSIDLHADRGLSIVRIKLMNRTDPKSFFTIDEQTYFSTEDHHYLFVKTGFVGGNERLEKAMKNALEQWRSRPGQSPTSIP